MSDWLYPISGTALLLVLALDVFRTVFHAEGRGGPINRVQNRTIWGTVRRLGTLGGRLRPRVLSWAGPLMATSTIAVWSLLLIGGFMLIYLPHVLSFHYSPGEPGVRLLEAFYYSGIVAATLGHGDVVARGGVLRMLTVLQALSGFALVTVAVTYVLGIYREVVASQALAGVLDVRLRGYGDEPAEGSPPTDPRQAGLEDHDGDWDRAITLGLAHVLAAHFNYPVLHYFRPSDSRRSLLPQLARLLVAGRAMEARRRRGAPETDAGPGTGLSHGALFTLIDRFITEIHSLFVGGGAGTESEAEGEVVDVEMARLRQVLVMMVYEVPEAA
jgi:hypothetical protein